MISVIIPTLNEEDNLPILLETLCAENVFNNEIIIVDGNSTDNTKIIAENYPVIFLTSPKRGRGQQLCTGLEHAKGDIIFFLHADSQISPSILSSIQSTLGQNSEYIGGNFKLLFDGNDDFSIWLNGFYEWLRSKGVYYGDSGIFIKRKILDQIGGLKCSTLMEDYDLIRRMEKNGPTCNIKSPYLITSSRRFAGRKKWEIIFGWIKIHILYYLGFSPDYMAKKYDSERTRERSI